MPPSINMKGKRFGSLIVLRRIAKCHHTYGAYWLCECICGKQVTKPRLFLRTGRSCYCGNKTCKPAVRAPRCKRYSSFLESARHHVLSVLKGECLRKGEMSRKKWALSDDQAITLIELACAYCGAAPYQILVSQGKEYKHGGIDRVKPNLPYTPENTVPCCKMCNRAKFNYSLEEFERWVDRLAAFRLIQKDLKTQHLCGSAVAPSYTSQGGIQ